MPIEDQYRKQLQRLLDHTEEMLAVPLTHAWRDGLTHLKQTLEYVTPRLGGAHPRPFLLERTDTGWQLTKPSGDWYKQYRDLHAVLIDVTQNDWFDVYLAENVRDDLGIIYHDPATTREMCDWLTDALNREDAPDRPTTPGDLHLRYRGGGYDLIQNGHVTTLGYQPEQALERLQRFDRCVYMDAQDEHALRESFPYVEQPAKDWLRTNQRRLRLAAIQEHFERRIASGDV